jgi:ornithine decarboxylase
MPPRLERYPDVGALLQAHAPESPFYCLHPERLAAQARRVLRAFQGPVRFDVRVNPHPVALEVLRAAGVSRFGAYNAPEAALARDAAAPELVFLNPFAPRVDLRRAAEAGARRFAVDGEDTLRRAIESTGGRAPGVSVLLALPPGLGGAAEGDGCRGASPEEAVRLLRSAVASGLEVAVAIQPGLAGPEAAAGCLELAAGVLARAGVRGAEVDLGATSAGGSTGAVSIEALGQAVSEAARRCGVDPARVALAPSAALVSVGGSVVTQVLLRKGDRLYLDDGRFSWLYTLGRDRWRTLPPLPVGVWRRGRDGRFARVEAPAAPVAFRAFGPTCDSYDELAMPFRLPPDVAEGDLLEVEHLGADAVLCASHFNGLYSDRYAVIGAGSGPPGGASG